MVCWVISGRESEVKISNVMLLRSGSLVRKNSDCEYSLSVRVIVDWL
jgi:hypothetical protein